MRLAVLATAAMFVGAAGCSGSGSGGGSGRSVGGTYVNSNGSAKVHLKSGGKALIEMAFGTEEASYQVKGDKILIAMKGEKEPQIVQLDDGGCFMLGLLGNFCPVMR